MADNIKSIPLPKFIPEDNRAIRDSVNSTDASINPNSGRIAAPKKLSNFSVESNNVIIDKTNEVKRGVAPVFVANEEGVSPLSFMPKPEKRLSVYSDPIAPIRFPQAEDIIKSLNFSTAATDQTTKDRLSEYYALVSDLVNGRQTPEQYYAKMPGLIETIKDYTLNETDWETLRDAVLGVQRYIINFIWGDMQRISRSMDLGFKEYQDQLNAWIDEANRYYSSEEFIPGGTVKLWQLGRAEGGTNTANKEYEVQQNVKYLIDGMCVQMSKTRPDFPSGDGSDINHYPNSKGMVWLEELN